MRTIFASLLALAVLPLASPAHAESGEIVCRQELSRVERLFEQTRDRLSPAEARQIEQRLAAAPSYCIASPYPSSVTLSGVDQIGRRLVTVPQVAERPPSGASAGIETR